MIGDNKAFVCLQGDNTMTLSQLNNAEEIYEWGKTSGDQEFGRYIRPFVEDMIGEIRKCWKEIESLQKEVCNTQIAYAKWLLEQGR